MLGKALGFARALAVILSVVAAFVAIPNIDTNVVLVLLGLVAGTAYGDDARPNVILTAIAMPVTAVALGHLPAIGIPLGAIASNIGLVAAGAVASSMAIHMFQSAKGDLSGLTK